MTSRGKIWESSGSLKNKKTNVMKKKNNKEIMDTKFPELRNIGTEIQEA